MEKNIGNTFTGKAINIDNFAKTTESIKCRFTIEDHEDALDLIQKEIENCSEYNEELNILKECKDAHEKRLQSMLDTQNIVQNKTPLDINLLAPTLHDETFLLKWSRSRGVSFGYSNGSFDVIVRNCVTLDETLEMFQFQQHHVLKVVRDMRKLRETKFEVAYIWGEKFPMEIDKNATNITFDGNKVIIPPDCLRSLAGGLFNIKKWITFYSKMVLPEAIKMLNDWSEKVGLTYQNVSIFRNKSRAGECDRHGNIKINWAVGLGPKSWLDEVTLHELAHTKYFDHGPAFKSFMRTHNKSDSEHKTDIIKLKIAMGLD